MKYLIQNKHWNIVEEYNIDKLLYLLIDRPSDINSYNTFFWINNKNQLQRNYDLPTSNAWSGSIFWRKNNLLHRENNKPAIIFNYGRKEYYLNNKFIK